MRQQQANTGVSRGVSRGAATEGAPQLHACKASSRAQMPVQDERSESHSS